MAKAKIEIFIWMVLAILAGLIAGKMVSGLLSSFIPIAAGDPQSVNAVIVTPAIREAAGGSDVASSGALSSPASAYGIPYAARIA